MSKKSVKSASKEKEVSSYAWRDIVLGKVRGYPPWPGMIVDPETAPEAVQQERPAKKANFYCVQFFPTGDFAWLVAKDISKLQRHEIESYINEPFKKSGDLLQGYRNALDPDSWEADRASALAAIASMKEDVEEDDGGEVDELETDDEGKKKVKSKKRKREGDAVTAKTRKAAGSTKEKKEKSGARKAANPNNKGRKSAKSKHTIGVESEDDGADAEGEDAGSSAKKAGSPPPTKKARRDKDDEHDDAKLGADPEAVKVRDWRHRLQKAFLSSNKNQVPDDADLPALDQLFTTVESYQTMTVAYLQFSKIGKVMRHITLLPPERLPKDNEYHFRDRAKALVERWQLVLGAAKGGENGSTGTGGMNGTSAKDAAKDDASATTKDVKDQREQKLNGAEDTSTKVVTTGTAALDLNGTGNTTENHEHGDTDITAVEVPTDADATGDADADISGQADAPGEAEDVAMAEA